VRLSVSSYLDYIEEDGTLDWPRRPQSFAAGDRWCMDCGSMVEAILDGEDCIKACHPPCSHTIGSAGQIWLPSVADFHNARVLRLKEEKQERQDAARRLGVPRDELVYA
jgi:hypothetical protein